MTQDHERIVLLNTMISRSKTRTRKEPAPIHSAYELLKFIEVRQKQGLAIEFRDAADADDDAVRISNGQGHDFVRLREIAFSQTEDYDYAVLLLEFFNARLKSFPVVHQQTFEGREIEGSEDERGAHTAHVGVRIPKDGFSDDGTYRCVIESVREISRKTIETFLCRQLKRYAASNELTFTLQQQPAGKRKKAKSQDYRYTPRLELGTNVGRALNSLTGGAKELSLMVFTKRREKQSTAKTTIVDHEDYLADIEYRVSASQGPADPNDRQNWFEAITTDFRLRGFDTKLYYRHLNGRTISGNVHQSMESATDLLMCPKEFISLSEAPRQWHESINAEIAKKFRELLDRDAIWQVSE